MFPKLINVITKFWLVFLLLFAIGCVIGWWLAYSITQPSKENLQNTSKPIELIYTVQSGDSLVYLAEKSCGSREIWKDFVTANPKLIGRENNLEIGETLVFPQVCLESATSAKSGNQILNYSLLVFSVISIIFLFVFLFLMFITIIFSTGLWSGNSMFTKPINSLTKFCCGVGIFDIHDRVSQTKNLLVKSEERAKAKRLKEAIQLAKSGMRLWSQNPNFWEKLFRKWFLSDLLIKLEESSKKWSGQMQNAQRLIQEGNNLLTLEPV